jgi:Uma2 family endonuclease
MGLIDLPELLSRHRVTVDEYYRMADVGVLAPEARVELIRGEVVDMAPIGSRHGGCVKILNNRLCAAVGERAVVAVQDPLRIGKHSEPQPDVMVLRLRSDNYRDAHPTPADVLLLIEVSDTTARYDREIKLPLYAEAGVPEVWIVDIDAQLLRCHRRPAGLEYTEMQALPAPSLIAVPGVEGAKLELGDLFG